MKNLMNTMVNAIQSVAEKVKKAISNTAAAKKLATQNGQFVMEHAVVFVIILVLAAIAIGILILYMQGDLKNLLTGKVEALFN